MENFNQLFENRITIADIVAEKGLTDQKMNKDLQNLRKYKATENENKQCGNPFLYHFQVINLMKCRPYRKKTLVEILEDKDEYQKLERLVEQRKRSGKLAIRFFEAWRVNQAVVFFKPSTAKFVYKHFGATHVLDFTAGWGGRMLGADALGIHYTGIDTNVGMTEAYDGMMTKLNNPKLKMIWSDCLSVNLEEIDYDLVLTSPPYVNKSKKMVETYVNQNFYEDFYEMFLIPMIKKSLQHIKRNGKVCININKEMYDEVAKRFRPCNEHLSLLQQKRNGKDKDEKIFIWYN
jgi:hypothetical protein